MEVCVTTSIRVPLSKCTLLPAEVIIEPCVLLLAAEFKLSPLKLKTPRLFDVS